MQGFLGTLPIARIVGLQREVDAALEQCEDSIRHMAVYRDGDDLARRIRAQYFDKDRTPLTPHRVNDSLHRLHERLGCHTQHSIPMDSTTPSGVRSCIFTCPGYVSKSTLTHLLRRRAPAHHHQRWHQHQRAVLAIHRAARTHLRKSPTIAPSSAAPTLELQSITWNKMRNFLI